MYKTHFLYFVSPRTGCCHWPADKRVSLKPGQSHHVMYKIHLSVTYSMSVFKKSVNDDISAKIVPATDGLVNIYIYIRTQDQQSLCTYYKWNHSIKTVKWTIAVVKDCCSMSLDLTMMFFHFIFVCHSRNDLRIFRQVTYHTLDKVFDRAAAEQKLVHSIILWGSLDDQSCWGWWYKL